MLAIPTFGCILPCMGKKSASAGAVRGGNPAEAFAKGGDSDERWGAPSLVSGSYNTAGGRDGPLSKVILAA